MSKLSIPQRRVLTRIAAITAVRKYAHAKELATRVGTLDALREAGLITSAGPFSGAYHTIRLTAAGERAVIGESTLKSLDTVA